MAMAALYAPVVRRTLIVPVVAADLLTDIRPDAAQVVELVTLVVPFKLRLSETISPLEFLPTIRMLKEYVSHASV